MFNIICYQIQLRWKCSLAVSDNILQLYKEFDC